VQLAVATPRPTALDVNAQTIVRYAPGGEAAFLAALDTAVAGGRVDDGFENLAELGQLLREGGEDVVIVWGERLGSDAARYLLSVADTLGLAGRDGAGLLEIPAGANGRGLREVGAVPYAGPGYASVAQAGRSAHEIARAAADGEITALHLFQIDPVRDLPDRALWEQAMQHAGLVVAHASIITEGIREHANVVFPAESYAEKEGTVVHPDGRVQRLRTAIAHPGEVRFGWSVIADIARRAGSDLRALTSGMVFKQIVETVPFYEGLTLEEIGGRGIRWPARGQASRLPDVDSGALGTPRISPSNGDERPRDGALRLGTYRSIWAAPEVEVSPALKFTAAHQLLELSPADAQRLEVTSGDAVAVSQNGTRLSAEAHVRTGVPEGTVFLAEGIAEDSANALTEPHVEVSKR
jgi:NADH-quinone oxidoreductase subunit G